MSSTTPRQKKTDESTTEQFAFATADERHVNVRNCTKDSVYTVELTTDGARAMNCTCPDYKFRHAATVGGQCKHMAAVENDVNVEKSQRIDGDDRRVTGPHSAYAPTPRPEEFDHYTYWRCERCGAECVDKSALEDCC